MVLYNAITGIRKDGEKVILVGLRVVTECLCVAAHAHPLTDTYTPKHINAGAVLIYQRTYTLFSKFVQLVFSSRPRNTRMAQCVRMHRYHRLGCEYQAALSVGQMGGWVARRVRICRHTSVTNPLHCFDGRRVKPVKPQ